jgi:uncharacterized protein (TIGR02145 family)
MKTMKLLAIFALSIVMFSNGNNIIAQGTIKSVKIGNQVWMSENLNVSRFRNGDVIPEAKTGEEWKKAGEEGTPAWCYYNNDPENGKKYGKLYNWYTVHDKRGLAPEGWHIPTEAELHTLVTTANNNSNSLKAIGEGTGIGAGTNTSGFSVLLTGCCVGNGSGFVGLGTTSYLWSSEEAYDAKSGKYLVITMVLNSTKSDINFRNAVQSAGFSVRSVKD